MSPVVKVKKSLDKKQVAQAGGAGIVVGALAAASVAVLAVKKFGTEFIEALLGESKE